MRVQVLSDTHVEFHRDGGLELFKGLPGDRLDALILAGDVGVVQDRSVLEARLRDACAKYPTVLYLLGNHEFYGSQIGYVEKWADGLESRFPNLKLLKPDKVVKLGGRRFIGGTMWFPYDPMNGVYQGLLNDFNMILGDFVPWVYQENERFEDFLRREMGPGDIVVTHHLPSLRSVPPTYKGSALNRFFVSELDDLIVTRKPALWIHGHTHQGCDYEIEDTRIVCNPFGYPFEGKDTFTEQRIIEI
jgi:predicted phosphodiesterase